MDSEPQPLPTPDESSHLTQASQRLYRVYIALRWCLNGILVVGLIPPSLWVLRHGVALWFQDFTWTAVRYTLGFHPWATLGIILPLANITATLLRQSSTIIWGLSPREQYRLEQQALKIKAAGPRHPLWRWIWRPLGSQTIELEQPGSKPH